MHAAVDDVHHRHRQKPREGAADIAIERQIVGIGRSLRRRKRDAEHGIGAKPALVRSAVERDHRLVDLDLLFGVEATDGIENLAVDRIDRLADTLAAISLLVAVAQFHRLMRAGGGAGRHSGASDIAVFQYDIDLHGRIAAAVQNFTSDNVNDCSHEWQVPRFVCGASTG